jgi:hypothetical protein
MRLRYLAAIVLALTSLAFALDGQIGIHDPSTIIQCEGKYYDKENAPVRNFTVNLNKVRN